jgi:hypothetical protein
MTGKRDSGPLSNRLSRPYKHFYWGYWGAQGKGGGSRDARIGRLGAGSVLPEGKRYRKGRRPGNALPAPGAAFRSANWAVKQAHLDWAAGWAACGMADSNITGEWG